MYDMHKRTACLRASLLPQNNPTPALGLPGLHSCSEGSRALSQSLKQRPQDTGLLVRQRCLFLSWLNGGSLSGEALTTPKARLCHPLSPEAGAGVALPAAKKPHRAQRLHPPHGTEKSFSLRSIQGFSPGCSTRCQAIDPSSLKNSPSTRPAPSRARCSIGAGLLTCTQTPQPQGRTLPGKN